jgi:biopolymer transport protein TolR
MRRAATTPMAEINLTPFIDVLLVLLILFMIAVPAAQRGLDVAVPGKGRPAPSEGKPLPTPVLEVHAADFALGDERYASLEMLELALHATFAARHERALIVKSDPDVEYGRVIAAMDLARSAGVSRLGVLTAEPVPAMP